MTWIRKSYKLEEASSKAGVEERLVLEFIQNEWISPVEPDSRALDDEDIARLKLIVHLRNEFGVNDESMPIILRLLDQIHHLHSQLRKRAAD